MKTKFELIKIFIVTFFLYSKYDFQQINSQLNNNYDNNENQFEFEIIDYPIPIKSITTDNKLVDDSAFLFDTKYEQNSLEPLTYSQNNPNDYYYNYNLIDGNNINSDNLNQINNVMREDENIDNHILDNSLLPNLNKDYKKANQNDNENDFYIQLDNSEEQNKPNEYKNLIDYFYNLNEPHGLLKELKDDLDFLFYKNKEKNQTEVNDSKENGSFENLTTVGNATKVLLTTLIQNLASSKNLSNLHYNLTANSSTDNVKETNNKEYYLVSTLSNATTSSTTTLKALSNSVKAHETSTTTKQMNDTLSTAQISLIQNSTNLNKKFEELDNISKGLQKFEDFYDTDLETSHSDSPLLAKTNTFHFVEKRKNIGKKLEESNEKEKSDLDPNSEKYLDIAKIPTPTIYFIIFFVSIFVIINIIFFRVFVCHKKSE